MSRLTLRQEGSVPAQPSRWALPVKGAAAVPPTYSPPASPVDKALPPRPRAAVKGTTPPVESVGARMVNTMRIVLAFSALGVIYVAAAEPATGSAARQRLAVGIGQRRQKRHTLEEVGSRRDCHCEYRKVASRLPQTCLGGTPDDEAHLLRSPAAGALP